MSTKSTQKRIKKFGKLPGGRSYWLISARNFRQRKTFTSGNFIAKKATGKLVSRKSKIEVVGKHPQGFGKGFIWDRLDAEMLFVMFINPADHLGVCISGLDQGDLIQITSASGIAYFSKDNGNQFVSSCIGLIAAGAKVGSSIAGYPAAVPLIDAAEKFAKEQFKPTGKKEKCRNAYGVDPGSGHKARQEGGFLVSLPASGGPSYSGDNDHKERWIKEPGDRFDKNIPKHINYSFFPIKGNPSHNSRKLAGSGQLYVTPWDWYFDDNAGYYKVFLKIIKGNSSSTPIIE